MELLNDMVITQNVKMSKLKRDLGVKLLCKLRVLCDIFKLHFPAPVETNDAAINQIFINVIFLLDVFVYD